MWLLTPNKFSIATDITLTYQDVLHKVLKKSGTSPLQISTTGDLCHKMKAHMNISCNIFRDAVQKLYRSVIFCIDEINFTNPLIHKWTVLAFVSIPQFAFANNSPVITCIEITILY